MRVELWPCPVINPAVRMSGFPPSKTFRAAIRNFRFASTPAGSSKDRYIAITATTIRAISGLSLQTPSLRMALSCLDAAR